MDFFESGLLDVGIDLGGSDAGMAQDYYERSCVKTRFDFWGQCPAYQAATNYPKKLLLFGNDADCLPTF